MTTKNSEVHKKIYMWYGDKFFNDIYVKESTICLKLKEFQIRYNKLFSVPCKGLKFMNLSNKGFYCNKLGCPSCWHLIVTSALDRFSKLDPNLFYWIKSTSFIPWKNNFSADAHKAFTLSGSKYRFVHYCTNIEIDYGLECRNTLAYQRIGVIYSKDNHKLYKLNLEPDRKYINFGSNACVSIDQTSVDFDMLQSEWLGSITHPWLFEDHPDFIKMCERFKTTTFWYRTKS